MHSFQIELEFKTVGYCGGLKTEKVYTPEILYEGSLCSY